MTYLRFLAPLRPVLALSLPLLLSDVGCKSNVDEQIALKNLGQECLVNSDCSAPLACAFKACHVECESSRDCEDGARCVAAARPYKVCQLETERLCQRTADCAEGLICGVDGECRDQCQTDAQCVEGQVCVSGTCADKNELDDSGQLAPASGTTSGSEGSPCVYVSDCSAALLCRSQACLPECKADKDCGVHRVCQDARCVDDGTQPSACTYNSQCDTPRGELCLAGSCRCSCAEDRDCPSGQACDGCGCQTDPEQAPSCAYNSDCKSPGEVCKNRVCACQCQADADCAAGSVCDGCGCVDAQAPIHGIVNGSVYISSTLQLATFRGVTEIHGSLSISGTALADLGDTFDQLTIIDGTLQVNDAKNLSHVAFPKLTSFASASFSAVEAQTLELPALQSGSLNLKFMTSLTALSLKSWQEGELVLMRLPKLAQLELPKLKTLGMLQLSDVPLVPALDMPELTAITNSVFISSGTQAELASLTAPQLALLGAQPNTGSVNIDNTKLTSLSSFGKPKDAFVSHVTNLQLTRNGLLGDCAAQLFAARLTDRTTTIISETVACAGSCDGETCSN